MEAYKSGDKSKSICETCKKITTTTFLVRDTTIQNGEQELSLTNCLVAVCDTCDSVVSIPQQSFGKITIKK